MEDGPWRTARMQRAETARSLLLWTRVACVIFDQQAYNITSSDASLFGRSDGSKRAVRVAAESRGLPSERGAEEVLRG